MMLQKWLVIGLIAIIAVLGFFQARKNTATLAQIGVGFGVGFGSGNYGYGGGPSFGVGVGSGGYYGGGNYPYTYGSPAVYGGYNTGYYHSYDRNAVYTNTEMGLPVNVPIQVNPNAMQPYYFDGHNVWSNEDLYRNGSFRQVSPDYGKSPQYLQYPQNY